MIRRSHMTMNRSSGNYHKLVDLPPGGFVIFIFCRVATLSSICDPEKIKTSLNNMSWLQINKYFEHKSVIIFLAISFNKCSGCSKEPSH